MPSCISTRTARLVIATAAAGVAGILAWAPAAQAAPAAAVPQDGARQKITDLVNKERHEAGCAPVRLNDQLNLAAQRHSDDMANRHFFSHTNPDGPGPGKRITAAGYRWTAYGENIAYGQPTAADVMNDWMHSDGHRENILDCSFTEIGVGINHAPGGPRWTQEFGAR
ncbi:hypothetical protein GCM10010218_05500 [Streptomyces mashuensis]|uniref:SCP domain-containing protein n=1 Tax=Streptomyces mashuensis TaxID=33904 RepID=A0A919EA19_9ACTN|nr:hypothetical protein GCM10010218_05500 [Streptomyces mashuensis]